MRTAERFQCVVVERLHAERDAVDAGGAITLEACRLDAGGVSLERYLDVLGDRPVLGDGLENRANRGRLHQRRGATAKEDRGDRALWNPRRGCRDLGGK